MENISILLVEDEIIDRIAIERLIKKEQLPYSLTFADTVAQAISSLKENKPDLALIDYKLPDGSGLEVQQHAGDTPCVFITGMADQTITVNVMKAGAYDFVVKDNQRNYLKMLPSIIQAALERARTESQVKLQQHILNNINEMVLLIDDQGQVIFANNAVEQLLGYSPQTVIGDKWWKTVFPNPQVAQALKQQIADRAAGIRLPAQYDLILQHHNGEQIWTAWVESIGEAGKISCVGRDITDRVRMEQALKSHQNYLEDLVDQKTTQLKQINRQLEEKIAELEKTERILRENEDRLRYVLDVMPVMLDAFDVDGNIIFWNGECERVTGYSAKEVVNNPQALAFFYPNLDYRQQRRNQMLDPAEDFRSFEWNIVCKTGEIKTISWFNLSKRFPIAGWHSWSIGIDITKRKHAEEQRERLLASEREQRLLAETLQGITLALTAQTNYKSVLLEVLHQVQRIVPYTAAGFVLIEGQKLINYRWQGDNQTQGKLITTHTRSHLENAFVSRVIQSSKPLVIANTQFEPNWDADPAMQWVKSYLAIPILLRQQVLGLLQLQEARPNKFSAKDVQKLQPLVNAAAIALDNARLYEQARLDAETKNMLLDEVNHRVKNNLAAIIGLLYAERRHTRLEDGVTYATIMNDLVGQVQGLATVHSLLSASQWQPLQLSTLAQQVIRSSLQILPRDKKIVVNLEPSPVTVTPAQAHSLALIINELITNTIKWAFVAKNQIEVGVKITQSDEVISLAFRDNGPGYSNHVLEANGHNVGLYLLKNIVKNELNGELCLYNDHGAVTIITLKEIDTQKGEKIRGELI